MRKHPWSALAFIWSCDLLAAVLVAAALWRDLPAARTDWVHFIPWTIMLSLAHLGRIDLVGLNAHTGWFVAVDFAALLVLPFPLFALSTLIWTGLLMAVRLRRGHPEPFLGPDFNAAMLTLSGAAAGWLYQVLTGVLGRQGFGGAISLLPAAAAFVTMQALLLATLLALDEGKPWRQSGALNTDVLVSDGLMATMGALIGRIYQFDPFLLGFTIPPILFLHKTLARLNEAKLAYVDGKTGLFNYRYFDINLAESFRKAAQNQRPLALVFADMDHLRDVNNTYGHLAGDQALAAVALAMQRAAPPDAMACRFGGEEFVLLLPGYDKNRAATVAERVRRAVAESTVQLESGESIRVTVSLGVAAYPVDAKTEEELIKAADEAVYEAKNSGRNRVCLYHRHGMAMVAAARIEHGAATDPVAVAATSSP